MSIFRVSINIFTVKKKKIELKKTRLVFFMLFVVTLLLVFCFCDSVLFKWIWKYKFLCPFSEFSLIFLVGKEVPVVDSLLLA